MENRGILVVYFSWIQLKITPEAYMSEIKIIHNLPQLKCLSYVDAQPELLILGSVSRLLGQWIGTI